MEERLDNPPKEIESDMVAIDKNDLFREIGIAIRQIKDRERSRRFWIYIIIIISICLNIWLLCVGYMIKTFD